MTVPNNISGQEKLAIEPGWTVIEEERASVYNDGKSKYRVDGIVRDSDGFTLFIEGGNSIEGFDIFSFRFGNELFEFIAYYDLPAESSSTYIVEAGKSKPYAEMMYKHAKDIEAAILVCSAMEKCNLIRVKEIKFDISESFAKPHVVNAKEIQS